MTNAASKKIPVNLLPSGIGKGMVIVRIEHDGKPNFMEVERSHRDSGYTFILQEKGITQIEIDFQVHTIRAPAIIYIHPNQVHRLIAFEQAVVSSWIINAENLQPEYFQLLEDLAPAKTLPLGADVLVVLSETASLCIKLFERKEEKLYGFILKESFNTLVALVTSQYLAQEKPVEHYSRFEFITKSFRSALEKHFATMKSPTAYADLLNISTAYLNECVKNVTGFSVSHHIQQRIVLEAKRLLFHSNNSVKEIAAGLGYDDYAYFTRLFVKVTGVTPTVFRTKNRDLS
jgi:AraC family transcriptional regulator, transcriptional activator of pobA